MTQYFTHFTSGNGLTAVITSILFFILLFVSNSLCQDPASSGPSVADILDRDGKIKKGVVGGFNAAGFEMKLDEHGVPRFVPSAAAETRSHEGETPVPRSLKSMLTPTPTPVIGYICHDDFDHRFYNNGTYDDDFYHYSQINAIAITADSIYIGGRFSIIDNVYTKNIARYDRATETWSALKNGGLTGGFGPDIIVRALAISGNNLFVGGKFKQTADGMVNSLNGVARYDIAGDTWWPLANNGVTDGYGDFYVNALALSGNDLYIGGNFKQTFDGLVTNLKNIARYTITSPTTGTWTPLVGNGLSDSGGQFGGGYVNAIAISGNDLFAGGYFTRTTDGTVLNLSHIARFDLSPSGTWSALTHNGLDNNVQSLLISGTNLFVGGTFTQTANGAMTNLWGIARYSITPLPTLGTWSPLGTSGLSNGAFSPSIEALAVDGNDLYVGGYFTQTMTGSSTNLGNIARYNISGDIWSALNNNGVDNNGVFSLATAAGDLIVGGRFNQTGDGVKQNLNNTAKYKLATNTWSVFGSTTGLGLNSPIQAVAVNATDIYVAGNFLQTVNNGPFTGPPVSLNGIARFNLASNRWAALANDGLNGVVSALAISGSDLYVGGTFTATSDGAVTNLNKIARYDTSSSPGTWSPPFAGNGLNGQVNALIVAGTTLFAGGSFTQSFDGSATNLNRIARYDTSTNALLPPLTGNGLNNVVNAFAVSGSDLFVGGNFTQTLTGGTVLNRVARYNTTTNTWTPFAGDGLNSYVNAFAVSGTTVFVGGGFSQSADGSATDLNFIARYDASGNTWLPPLTGNGLNSDVNALVISGNHVFVGGSFTQTNIGATNLKYISRYDTATNTWSGRGLDLNNSVNALGISGTDLVIGGFFTRITGCGVGAVFTRHYLEEWIIPARPVGNAKNAAVTPTDWFDGSNWSTGAAPAANTNAFIPVGSGDISITSADVTMNDLLLSSGTMTIAAGRTLTINGILGLGGTITGAGTVVVTSCKSDAIVNADATAGFIQTTLVRCVNNGGAFEFPVGTASGYSPVTVKNIGGAGNISVKPNQGAYSNPATGMPINRLARWWQIENPGGGVTGSDLYFNYLQSDIAGNEYGYRAYRVSGGTASVIAGSVNTFSNTVTAPNVSGFSDWTLAEFAPSAATVSVAGRVTSWDGIGISKAVVMLSDQDGSVRRVLTGSLGYYRFDDVAAGQTCVLSVGSKRYQFAEPTRVISVADDALDIGFIALP